MILRTVYTLLFWLCISLSNLALGDTLKVAIASNFMTTAKKLIIEFETESGHQVQASYGSSGKLAAQITHGAPFEIFLSADQKTPIYLEQTELAVKGTRFTYATGKLSLCSKPKVRGFGITQLSTLSQNIRIVFANEKLAPYGKAAHEILDKLEIIESSRNNLIRAENVSQALQFYISGNVDLALVALSQTLASKNLGPNECQVIPKELYSPILQDAILLKNASNSTTAKEFLDFLRMPNSLEIIKQAGYH